MKLSGHVSTVHSQPEQSARPEYNTPPSQESDIDSDNNILLLYVIFWWILLLPTRICFTDYELWTTSKCIQYTGHRCCEYIPCYLKIPHSNTYNELYCHCGMKIYFSICCNVLQHYIVFLHYYVNPLKLILSNMPYITKYCFLYECTCISVKHMFILFYIICVLISPPQIINNHNYNIKTYSIVLIYYATNNILYCYTSSQKISNIKQKQITVNIYSTLQIVRVVSYIIPCIDLIVRMIINDDSFLCTRIYVHPSCFTLTNIFSKINFCLSKNVDTSRGSHHHNNMKKCIFNPSIIQLKIIKLLLATFKNGYLNMVCYIFGWGIFLCELIGIQLLNNESSLECKCNIELGLIISTLTILIYIYCYTFTKKYVPFIQQYNFM